MDHSEYSEDGRYRWRFERRWDVGPALCWIGLNPSTGDSNGGRRPTLRKVIGWARRERCAAVVVVNLFSYRATDPKELKRFSGEVVGDDTDEHIRRAHRDSLLTLVAWGARGNLHARSAAVMQLVDEPVCVGRTKHGEPLHPLYVPAATPFQHY